MAKFEKGNIAGTATRWQAGKSRNPGGLPPVVAPVHRPQAPHGRPTAVAAGWAGCERLGPTGGGGPKAPSAR